MFGCFETFLMQQGAVLEALFVVNLHGSLEIPTIILSGASALALGTGWLFPGRRSRIEAFRQARGADCSCSWGCCPSRSWPR